MGRKIPVLKKLKTGIPGFDTVAEGGLPLYRSTLVAGSSGSGKTVFAVQYLAEGIQQFQENGVFISFEESTDDIKRNIQSLGWDLEKWEKEQCWAFVDAAPQLLQEECQNGEYDLGALLARIECAVKKVNAKRVVLDSIGSIFNQFEDEYLLRREFLKIISALKKIKVTTVITAERLEEYGDISRYGIKEFVADNVVILRNVLDTEKRRRTVEVLKFRGTSHQKGEWPFTILSEEGVVVLPLSGIELNQSSSDKRISSGNAKLDEICGGGFFRDSIVLVTGASGCGKTLMSTEFIAGGAESKEKTLLFAFEESRDQLFRNARGWGKDFAKLEEDGLLKVVCSYPESRVLEDHLITIKRMVEEYQPDRIAIDSLSALERVASEKSFREFVIGLSSFIKSKELACIYTSTTSSLLGGRSVTESHISTLTDSIILLRYVEVFGEMRRSLTVLKMRGSRHDKDIFEFTIDSTGMHVQKPFRNISGILSGNIQHYSPSEIDRVSHMFEDVNG